MGGPKKPGLKPGGQGDEGAKENAELVEGPVTHRMHELVELAQREDGDETDKQEGAVGAVGPEDGGDNRPQSDGAEGAFDHGQERGRAEDGWRGMGGAAGPGKAGVMGRRGSRVVRW